MDEYYQIKFYKSIKFKFIWITLVMIIIPIILVFIFYNGTLKSIFIEKYSDSALESIKQTGDKMDYYFRDIEEFSNSILANRVFLDHLKSNAIEETDKIYRDLQNFYASRDDIDGLGIKRENDEYSVGVEKEQLYINDNKIMSNTPMTWIPSEQYTVEVFSGKFIKPFYSLRRPIIDYISLEYYGDLYIDIDEQKLYDLYKGVLEEGSDIFICDSNGRILSHDYKTKIGRYIIYEPFGTALTKVTKKSDVINYVEKGKNRVVLYTTLPSNGWKLVKTISTEALFSEIISLQTNLIIGGVIYCIGIIGFLSMFFVRFTKPMKRMVSDFKKVENGDLTVQTYIDSEDEIGQIGKGFNKMVVQMDRLIKKSIEEEQFKKQLELESLHAQINPHFLYNTLNTIKWMAKIQEANSVSNAITALVKLLRISTNLGTDKITLTEEIEYVKNYIAIQSLRFGGDIDIEYNIEETCYKCYIPKLILQPIVENSILYNDSSITKIIISANMEGKYLIITIKDNGPGITEEKISTILNVSDENKFSKVGLNNVNQRIKLYNSESCGLSIIADDNNGTTVKVKLLIDDIV